MSRQWAVVSMGESDNVKECARFRADGDAYIYAKDIANRGEQNGWEIWLRPTCGISTRIRADR